MSGRSCDSDCLPYATSVRDLNLQFHAGFYPFRVFETSATLSSHLKVFNMNESFTHAISSVSLCNFLDAIFCNNFYSLLAFVFFWACITISIKLFQKLLFSHFFDRLFRSFSANWKWKFIESRGKVWNWKQKHKKRLKTLKRISGWKFSCRFHFTAGAHKTELFVFGWDAREFSRNPSWCLCLIVEVFETQ